MEQDYNSLQEEVDEKSKLLNKLRKRYKAALAEIEDLENENWGEKSELLETIRTIEVDLGFYKVIVDMLLTSDNLYKIKSKSQYDDETKEWTVPPFVLKGKQINLPKLGLQKAKQFIEEEKVKVDVHFKEEPPEESDENYYQDNNQSSVSKSVIYNRKRPQKSN